MSNLDQFSGAELTVAELDIVAGGGKKGGGAPSKAPSFDFSHSIYIPIAIFGNAAGVVIGDQKTKYW